MLYIYIYIYFYDIIYIMFILAWSSSNSTLPLISATESPLCRSPLMATMNLRTATSQSSNSPQHLEYLWAHPKP